MNLTQVSYDTAADDQAGTPARMHGSMASRLKDCVGNPHRSEQRFDRSLEVEEVAIDGLDVPRRWLARTGECDAQSPAFGRQRGERLEIYPSDFEDVGTALVAHVGGERTKKASQK